MEFFVLHLKRIAAAGLICAAMTRLLDGKGTAGNIGKMLTGLFLAFTVITPLVNLQFPATEAWIDDLRSDAQAVITAGQMHTNTALRQVIKQRTEAYILDKANSLAAQIAVEVTLSDDTIPIPIAVRLSGNISPYAKQQLRTVLEQELGIAKEAQLWI